MAYFHTTVLDEQIKALPTVDTASGSVASFETDKSESLLYCYTLLINGTYSNINLKVCQTNLFDEVMESGGINTQGNDTVDATRIRTANYNLCSGGLSYYVVCPTGKTMAFRFYQYDKTHISGENITVTESGSYIFPSNAKYFRFVVLDTTVYDNNMAVNYPDSKTEYEEYKGNTNNIAFGETVTNGQTFDFINGILVKGDNTKKLLTPTDIQPYIGSNNIITDLGNVYLEYVLSIGKKIR
jgi:hypothetical protein